MNVSNFVVGKAIPHSILYVLWSAGSSALTRQGCSLVRGSGTDGVRSKARNGAKMRGRYTMSEKQIPLIHGSWLSTKG
jgi:hypothetical protein